MRTSRRVGERGTAAVEFALVLPLLLVLTLALVQVGLLAKDRLLVEAAARAGKHVLLLDDILDTGKTLTRVVSHLLDKGAESVKVAVLLRKVR